MVRMGAHSAGCLVVVCPPESIRRIGLLSIWAALYDLLHKSLSSSCAHASFCNTKVPMLAPAPSQSCLNHTRHWMGKNSIKSQSSGYFEVILHAFALPCAQNSRDVSLGKEESHFGVETQSSRTRFSFTGAQKMKTAFERCSRLCLSFLALPASPRHRGPLMITGDQALL